MQLQTKHFGAIDVDEKDVLFFPSGIPGFENTKKFVLLGKEQENSPFFWLQGVDDPDLAFVVTDPFFITPDYFVDVDDEQTKELQIKDAERILTLAIVTVPENVQNMTVNLKAPVLINMQNNLGRQVIMKNETFSVKYYIMKK